MSGQAIHSNFLVFRMPCLGLSLASWVLGCFGFLPGSAAEQTLVRDGSTLAQQGIALAQTGRCREALPLLKRAAGHLAQQPLKYQTEMATARCAMSLDQTEAAVQALLLLKREFPKDPEVLYIVTHFYSELASRTAQELAAAAPNSPQAGKLEAESFESQGNWDKAIAQYMKIPEQNPRATGVHYRLGRIFLSKSPSDAEEARKEFQEELKIDSGNASAEFMLEKYPAGELAPGGLEA